MAIKTPLFIIRFYHTTSHYLCHQLCYHVSLVEIIKNFSRNLKISSFLRLEEILFFLFLDQDLSYSCVVALIHNEFETSCSTRLQIKVLLFAFIFRKNWPSKYKHPSLISHLFKGWNLKKWNTFCSYFWLRWTLNIFTYENCSYPLWFHEFD